MSGTQQVDGRRKCEYEVQSDSDLLTIGIARRRVCEGQAGLDGNVLEEESDII